MFKKMRIICNLLLMVMLLGSVLFVRVVDKEMIIGVIYFDIQGYYVGVCQGVQDVVKDFLVQVQLIEINVQGDILKESIFVDIFVVCNVDVIILLVVFENGSSCIVCCVSEVGILVICYNICIN